MSDLLALNEQEGRAKFLSCPPQLPVAYLGAKPDKEQNHPAAEEQSAIFYGSHFAYLSVSAA